MTYYHDVKKELKDADRPLTAKELHQRIGGHRTEIYRKLKRMREKDVVITDRDHEQKGVRRYQWRHNRS